ncbi:hypothetical protein [Streptomyces sp. SPB78]|uniref:hypothetical protein n=1 Tax=Streptomyces sp. (strain SPB78) TaxID=591157 RepID=UPI0001B583F8|nr:hypothetical protein [Streptomyces sp. SPB78]
MPGRTRGLTEPSHRTAPASYARPPGDRLGPVTTPVSVPPLGAGLGRPPGESGVVEHSLGRSHADNSTAKLSTP